MWQVAGASMRLLEQFDSLEGNSILLVSKGGLKTGDFYKAIEKHVEELAENKKVSRVTSVGPMINVEAKIYLDLISMRDKLKALIQRDSVLHGNVFVIQGCGPMKQMVDQVPRALHKTLKTTRDVYTIGGKITTWWPLGASRPAFSMHLDEACLISAQTDANELLMTITVNDSGMGKVQANELVARFQKDLENYDVLWPLDSIYSPNPKPMGKRPRGA
jgi:hypothetical protein